MKISEPEDGQIQNIQKTVPEMECIDGLECIQSCVKRGVDGAKAKRAAQRGAHKPEWMDDQEKKTKKQQAQEEQWLSWMKTTTTTIHQYQQQQQQTNKQTNNTLILISASWHLLVCLRAPRQEGLLWWRTKKELKGVCEEERATMIQQKWGGARGQIEQERWKWGQRNEKLWDSKRKQTRQAKNKQKRGEGNKCQTREERSYEILTKEQTNTGEGMKKKGMKAQQKTRRGRKEDAREIMEIQAGGKNKMDGSTDMDHHDHPHHYQILFLVFFLPLCVAQTNDKRGSEEQRKAIHNNMISLWPSTSPASCPCISVRFSFFSLSLPLFLSLCLSVSLSCPFIPPCVAQKHDKLDSEVEKWMN